MNEPTEARRDIPLAALGGFAALTIALGAFVVQNTQDTTIEWLFWDGTQPLWAILLLTSIAAALLFRFAVMVVRRRRA